MIRAAFFDIDGTLLDHSGGKSVFPASTAASLAALQRKGVKVFVATGRYPAMLGQIRSLFPFDGFVTVNGQLVTDREGRVLHRMAHDPETIRRLIPLVHKEGFACQIIEEEQTFPVTDSPEIKRLFGWLNQPLPPLYELSRLEKHPVIQFLVFLPLEEGKKALEPLGHIEVTSAGGDILDVIPQGGSKEVGIAAAAAYYGFSQREILVFGDGDNDARMLRWAGTGVAMGNASQAAKAAADHITAPVGEDGIQKALLHLGILSPEDFGEI